MLEVWGWSTISGGIDRPPAGGILPETIHPSILRSDDDPALRDGGRRRDRRAGVELPMLLPGGRVEHVEVPVVRPDVDAAGRDGGRRVDPRPRHERPGRLSR